MQENPTWSLPAFCLIRLAVETNAGAHGQGAAFKYAGQPVSVGGKFADDLLLLLYARHSSLESPQGWRHRRLPACHDEPDSEHQVSENPHIGLELVLEGQSTLHRIPDFHFFYDVALKIQHC